MTPFFSIITPVYNAEKYIGKCIESVLSQTLPDFELLLVDDGSPDNSGRICDEYAAKDTRIKVFHKDNGGVSSARNYGLDKANGKYIFFLDSDDFIDEEALRICKDEITTHNLDIFQFSIRRSGIDGNETNNLQIRRNTTAVLSPEEYVASGQFLVCAGGGCISKEIIGQNHIRFYEDIKLAEDQLFIITAITHSRRLKFSDQALYIYLDNPTSATHRTKTDDIIKSLKRFKEFISEYPLSNTIINRQTLTFINSMLYNNDITYSNIKKNIYTTRFLYFKNLRLSEKCFCILSKINFHFACFVTQLMFKLIK